MEQEVTKLLISQGPYAALFVALLFYVLKYNREREKEMQRTIDKLADLLRDDVGEVKLDIKRVLDKVTVGGN